MVDYLYSVRWINGMLLSFLNYDDEGNVDPEKSQIIPLVDGGTEGFKGDKRRQSLQTLAYGQADRASDTVKPRSNGPA